MIARPRLGTVFSTQVRATLIVIASLVLASAQADTRLSVERQHEIAEAALDAFDAAVAAQRSEPDRAKELYREAQRGFLSLARAGALNADLEYNLGNAAFRLGELGSAVLHFRRALRLDPSHRAAADNLRYVREQVQPQVAASTGAQLLGPFTWHTRISLRTRFWIAAAASALGWIGLTLCLRVRARPLLVASTTAAVVGLLAGGSAMGQLSDEAARPHAVVVGGEATLRLGRGEAYDPALRQPLGPGVELRINQERAGWVEVRLPDGISGWLPTEAVARV